MIKVGQTKELLKLSDRTRYRLIQNAGLEALLHTDSILVFTQIWIKAE